MQWLFASLIIFILGIFNLFAPIRGAFQYAFNPLQFGLEQVATDIRDGVTFYSNLKKIHMENLSLLEEVEGLRSEVLSLKELEEENQLLRDELKVGSSVDVSKGLILAQTFGNISDHTGTTIVLDKGTIHGVSIGDFVVKGKNLVGLIREASSQRSEVELITSPTLTISVIDFQTKTEGLARGEFGTSVVMEKILPSESVNVGDTVVTSGRDGKVFPGFLIGKVTEVSAESAEVLRSVSVEVLLDVKNLGKVFVVPAK